MNYVYHGSNRLIKESLKPVRATDKFNEADNKLCAVYASNKKEEAIATAIIKCEGVHQGSCGINNGKLVAKMKGKPTQDQVYLYTLDASEFEEKPKNSGQFVSLKPVKPIKIEVIKIDDYMFLFK